MLFSRHVATRVAHGIRCCRKLGRVGGWGGDTGVFALRLTAESWGFVLHDAVVVCSKCPPRFLCSGGGHSRKVAAAFPPARLRRKHDARAANIGSRTLFVPAVWCSDRSLLNGLGQTRHVVYCPMLSSLVGHRPTNRHCETLAIGTPGPSGWETSAPGRPWPSSPTRTCSTITRSRTVTSTHDKRVSSLRRTRSPSTPTALIRRWSRYGFVDGVVPFGYRSNTCRRTQRMHSPSTFRSPGTECRTRSRTQILRIDCFICDE